MADINWTTFYEQLQQDLADGSWTTKSYMIGTRKRELVSISEFLELLEYAKTQAQIQAGTVAGRTYGRPVRPR